MVVAAFLAQATEYLPFLLAFFTLAFFHMVYVRRHQRQAGSAPEA
jgi:hypothetical protein